MKDKARLIISFLAVFCLMAMLLAVTAFADGEEAKIGETTYPTLLEALEASVDGDTITLLKDVTWNETEAFVLGAKEITIDFGGNTLYVEKPFMIIDEDAGLTLVNADISSTVVYDYTEEAVFPFVEGTLSIASTAGGGIQCHAGYDLSTFVFANLGDIIVKDSTIDCGAFIYVMDEEATVEFTNVDGYTDVAYVLYTYGNSSVVFNSGTFESGDVIIGVMYEYSCATFNNGEYTSGEAIVYQTQAGATADFVSGTYESDNIIHQIAGGPVKITDGTYTTDLQLVYGLYLTSSLTIDGGIITANDDIISEADSKTTVTINGGTLVSENGNGINHFYGTLVITDGDISALYNGLYLLGADATISGGTFTSTYSKTGQYFHGMFAQESNIKLSGGTFTSNCDLAGIYYGPNNTITIAEGYRYDPEDWDPEDFEDASANIIKIVPIYVNVIFQDADETEIYKETVVYGGSVEKWPEDPKAPSEGAAFSGWLDADGKRVESDAVFEEDTVLTAAWTGSPVEPESPEPEDPDNPPTGDRADVAVWFICLIAAGFTAICTLRKMKRNNG